MKIKNTFFLTNISMPLRNLPYICININIKINLQEYLHYQLIILILSPQIKIFRSSHPEVFPEKSVLKICRSATSINWQSNFIEIALRHGCSPVNLLHTFRTPFPKNTSGRPLLDIIQYRSIIILIFSFQQYFLQQLLTIY